MFRSEYVSVKVNLPWIRANAEAIARTTGVPLIAVVKADAYGLGARRVSAAIADLVEAFYVFDLAEAMQYSLWESTSKRTIALLCESDPAEDYLNQRIHPVVWSLERAAMLAKARPVLSIDTGQQRFACSPESVDAILESGHVREAMTHASNPQQAAQFAAITDRFRSSLYRHVAGTSLLNEPATWFNAVRPGLALYQDAIRVETPLIEARDSIGPAGYTGFVVPRHGVIRCGYSHGLQVGPCLVNGVVRNIVEVGMQTAFVELGKHDKTGDTVTLQGDGLSLSSVASAWNCTAHLALLRLSGLGKITYVN